MSSTPKNKFITPRALSPRNLPPPPVSEVKELSLRDASVFMKTQFILLCRVPNQVYLLTSQKSGVKYISCHLIDVSKLIPLISIMLQIEDESVIARLSAFGEEAERLAKQMLPAHTLKFRNLKWLPMNSEFRGSCTCPVEFRALRETSVEVGDYWIDQNFSLFDAPPPSIPSTVQLYVG